MIFVSSQMYVLHNCSFKYISYTGSIKLLDVEWCCPQRDRLPNQRKIAYIRDQAKFTGGMGLVQMEIVALKKLTPHGK